MPRPEGRGHSKGGTATAHPVGRGGGEGRGHGKGGNPSGQTRGTQPGDDQSVVGKTPDTGRQPDIRTDAKDIVGSAGGTKATAGKTKGESKKVAAASATVMKEHSAEMVDTDEQLYELAELPKELEGKIFERERAIWKAKYKGTTTLDFKNLYRANNVRSAQTVKLPAIIKSLKDKGFIEHYPLMVSKKPGGKYLVIRGNRRTEGLETIQKAEPDVFEDVLPKGKIPCLVFENLTEDEETLLRIDHSTEEDRVGLDKLGVFLAVKQLVKAGWGGSQEDIAKKLGLYVKDKENDTEVPNRSFVQPHINLARMPEFVQAEFIKLLEEKKTPLRWTDIARLFKIYNAERNKGFVKDVGPEFKALWRKLLNPEEGPSAGAGNVPMMKKTELTAAIDQMSSRLCKLFALKVTGAPIEEDGQPLTLEDLDKQMTEAEAAVELLHDIGKHIGKQKFEAMVKEIRAKKRENARKEGLVTASQD